MHSLLFSYDILYFSLIFQPFLSMLIHTSYLLDSYNLGKNNGSLNSKNDTSDSEYDNKYGPKAAKISLNSRKILIC